jgi:hypothetical protein
MARVLLAAGFFYFILALGFKDSPGRALIQTVLLTAFMLPLYMLLDRFVYKRKLKRWEAMRDAKS